MLPAEWVSRRHRTRRSIARSSPARRPGLPDCSGDTGSDAWDAAPDESIDVVHIDDLPIEKIRRQSRNPLAIGRHHAPRLPGEHLEFAFSHIDPVESEAINQAVAGYLCVVAGDTPDEIPFVIAELTETAICAVYAESDARV